ncbi:MAG: hypothetical protein WC314_12535 [Vulcanimicrobiota bacterium]
MNISNSWTRPTPAFRPQPQASTGTSAEKSPVDLVRERFSAPSGPTTLADLSQGADKLSPREQDAARNGQKVFQQVKSHFESLSRADNSSSLDVNPQVGHYTSTPSSRPVPTFSTIERWSEAEGPQRTIVNGFVNDEGTQAVTLPGQEKMAVASTYSDEDSSRQVPGGMYFYTDGDLEKAGLIDRQGKKTEVVASAQGGVLTVMESYNLRP